MNQIEIESLRGQCFDQSIFSIEILNWIEAQNLWNLWVPKSYAGREESLTAGLKILKHLAYIDGSLGWTVTLCSGANYFVGNLKEELASEIFLDSESPILGGSGGAFGTAERLENGYRVSGKWKYATGAPYLTHFTLNARITVDGEEVKGNDGKTIVRSFIVPKDTVEIIPDWNTMGLKATATHSFTTDVFVDERNCFEYNQCYLDQSIFKVPFSLFADLTLWVNYVGMAEHFVEEAQKFASKECLKLISDFLSSLERKILNASEETEKIIGSSGSFPDEFLHSIHNEASVSVRELTQYIIDIYPALGIQGSSENQQINQIFRDYFTATQHNIFSKK